MERFAEGSDARTRIYVLDARLAAELCGFGVHLLATAHAENVQDMRRRPSYRKLLDSGVFTQAVVIELNGERKYRFEKLT